MINRIALHLRSATLQIACLLNPSRFARAAFLLLLGAFMASTAQARIYIADQTLNQINIYATDASGNTAPTATIAGSLTALSQPFGVATDANFIYVANWENSGLAHGNSVTIYPINARGNVAPVRTISGSNTGLYNCIGIAVDSNYIYVVNEGTVGAPLGAVTVYPLAASGNYAPVATIGGSNTGFAYPEGIAIDSSSMYITSPGGGDGGAAGGSLSVFPLNANGNALPTVYLANSTSGLATPSGVAVNGSSLFVSNGSSFLHDIAVFSLSGLSDSSTPTVTISGSSTGLGGANGVAINGSTIFVRNSSDEEITEYPLAGSGNIAPSATLGGIGTVSMITASPFITVDSTSFTPAKQGDFTGDGNADILWQNTSTGDCGLYLMNGVSIAGWVDLGTIASQWTIAGTGDFLGDGDTDIVWQNTSTGVCGIYMMNGTTVTGWVGLGTVPTEWKIVGTGDFLENGNADIVWQNTSTGECGIYLMEGTSITGWADLGTISSQWQIVGVGAFNNTGQPDILWHNTATGDYGFYMMSGTTVTGWKDLGIVPSPWRVGAVADYNEDGSTDILWQNSSTGECGIYLMNGTTVTGWADLGVVATQWQIAP